MLARRPRAPNRLENALALVMMLVCGSVQCHTAQIGTDADYVAHATQVKRMKPLDFLADGGVWVPCAGSVTPWESHLGSEEYEPNARPYVSSSDLITDNSAHAFMRYYGKYENKTLFTAARATSGGFYPYRYGYMWETKVKADFTETTKKIYAAGRQAWEMAYVMPDEKTTYCTDDGENVMFARYDATTAKDLTAGKNYCAKFTQTSAADGDPKDWQATIEWVEMSTPTEAEVKAAIETTTFADIFQSADCIADGTCADNTYKAVNTGGRRCECLKIVPGKEKMATVFEKRRYAGYLGCTTEFNKWEGITHSPKHKKMWTAISAVERGMEDSTTDKYNIGTPNAIKVKKNSCGCVMEIDVDDKYIATKARMLVCGAGNTDEATKAVDSCATTGIASPDNVAMIEEWNQLIIGEDTGGHQNDLLWIWDFNTTKLTRIASTPYGSETTSPYWYRVGDFNYMTYVVQHPYGESDEAKNLEAEATGKRVT